VEENVSVLAIMGPGRIVVMTGERAVFATEPDPAEILRLPYVAFHKAGRRDVLNLAYGWGEIIHLLNVTVSQSGQELEFQPIRDIVTEMTSKVYFMGTDTICAVQSTVCLLDCFTQFLV
jgi:hypothetical protein